MMLAVAPLATLSGDGAGDDYCLLWAASIGAITSFCARFYRAIYGAPRDFDYVSLGPMGTRRRRFTGFRQSMIFNSGGIKAQASVIARCSRRPEEALPAVDIMAAPPDDSSGLAEPA